MPQQGSYELCHVWKAAAPIGIDFFFFFFNFFLNNFWEDLFSCRRKNVIFIYASPTPPDRVQVPLDSPRIVCLLLLLDHSAEERLHVAAVRFEFGPVATPRLH